MARTMSQVAKEKKKAVAKSRATLKKGKGKKVVKERRAEPSPPSVVESQGSDDSLGSRYEDQGRMDVVVV